VELGFTVMRVFLHNLLWQEAPKVSAGVSISSGPSLRSIRSESSPPSLTRIGTHCRNLAASLRPAYLAGSSRASMQVRIAKPTCRREREHLWCKVQRSSYLLQVSLTIWLIIDESWFCAMRQRLPIRQATDREEGWNLVLAFLSQQGHRAFPL
jgi:hypothetical protein